MNSKMSPGSEAGAPSTTPIADTELTAWHQGWSEPLTADDRADIAVLNAAAERGFRLAVRCTRCRQWLVAETSVRRRLGPVCVSKAAAQ
ncbi:hypothetical protein MSS4_04653 [Mycobacterium marinum]|uniref:DUF6011 domain-containing protein n=1 Tax=Mycobacterium marinum TaxID=1781 RepID=UPI000E3C11F2|nr:DUF6011 domain-containing protein [Mycobacterium marinum]RFZ42688.1 hypothetical protein MSS4_04653 [Mycobacterium marinum]